jgi:hypothetical protein
MANEIKSSNIIRDIDKRICQLSTNDIETIASYLSFHECEPMAAAERISEYLGVSYESIFELIN